MAATREGLRRSEAPGAWLARGCPRPCLGGLGGSRLVMGAAAPLLR